MKPFYLWNFLSLPIKKSSKFTSVVFNNTYRRNSRLLFVFLFDILIFSGYVYSQPYFQRTYGAKLNDYSKQIILCFDGNYAITGYNGTARGISLIKIDTFGHALWQKIFSPPDLLNFYYANSLKQTSDSGFIIAGNLGYYENRGAGIFLIKTSSIGDTLWTKFFLSSSSANYFTTANEIILTSDGGYAIIGKDDENVLLFKTDNKGELQWSASYGGLGVDEGYSIKQNPEMGFIIAGCKNNNKYWLDLDICLLKVDSVGKLLWTKTYGIKDSNDIATDLEIINDGGYILTGKIDYNGGDLFIMKTDSSGNIIWAYSYGGNLKDCGNAIKQTSDGGFIAAGFTNSFGIGKEDVYLIKINADGNVLWSSTYGGALTDIAYDVIEGKGGFIIAGETNNFTHGFRDIYVIKVDSFGSGTCKTDTALSTRKSLSLLQGSGGLKKYEGCHAKSMQLYPGVSDTFSYNPCYCVPPFAYFTVSMLDGSAIFFDNSAGAETWHWDFSDGDTSNLQNPTHSLFEPRAYLVCLTITNSCGKDTYCDSIYGGTGIKSLQKDEISFYIVPNPFESYTTIKFNNIKNEKLTLKLFNQLGKSVLIIDNIVGNEFRLDRGDLKSGLYFIEIMNSDQKKGVKKLIVK